MVLQDNYRRETADIILFRYIMYNSSILKCHFDKVLHVALSIHSARVFFDIEEK